MERSINPLFNVHERYNEMHIINPYRFALFNEKFGAPYVAYSLRLLSIGYGGGCIRVQRTSDSAELDIGFKSGFLDVDAFTDFIGEGAHLVIKWYDQGGGNKDATSTTATLIIPETGFPNLKGTFTVPEKLNFMHNGTTSSFFGVFKAFTTSNPDTYALPVRNNAADTAKTGFDIFLDDNSSTGRNDGLRVAATIAASGNEAVYAQQNGLWTFGQFKILHVIIDADNAKAANRLYVYRDNDVSSCLTNTYTASPEAEAYANMSINGPNLYGYEYIFYNSDKSSLRTNIRDDQNAYFLVY